MLAAGRPDQAIARELVVTLHTVKSTGYVLGKLGAANRTEGLARAARTEPHPLTRRPSHRQAADSSTRCRVEPAAGPVRALPGCGSRSPAGSPYPHNGQAPTPGQITPWCPVLPGRFHPACPFRGTPGPPDLPSLRRTECTPEGGSAMATVKPDPSNGGTALTRTAAALAS